MNFDLDTAHWEEFDQDWRYARPFDQNCNYLEAQAKLCKGSHRFYMYYNGHNNDHIGWMRYGYFEPTDALSIAGNAIRFVYTGGVKSDGNGGTQELGEPIYGFYQFLEKYSELGDGLYAGAPLPGTPTVPFNINEEIASTLLTPGSSTPAPCQPTARVPTLSLEVDGAQPLPTPGLSTPPPRQRS